MQTTSRQSVGIDIAKKKFSACFCQLDQQGSLIYSLSVEFANSTTGFNQLLKWVRKLANKTIPIVFVMEATGVYYEPLAYHLHKIKQAVRVVLPNKVKHYAKSLNVKSKTDAIDARVIARLGIERTLEPWQPAALIFRELRALTRLYTDFKQQKTVFSNRLESVEAGYEPSPYILKANKAILQQLDQQIQKCQQQIQQVIAREAWLQAKVEKLLTIKGVGLITVAIILAETQGFALIRNAKQLTSYAGYDVVERQSGSSIKGSTHISKKGNSRIRAALHFPALVASRHNPLFRRIYQRINQTKSSKMVGATALQRKVLVLLYSLWKNDTIYRSSLKEATATVNPLPVIEVDQKLLNTKEIGRSTDLPTQDEPQWFTPADVLLRQGQSL